MFFSKKRIDFSSQTHWNILVVRNDGLGDLVLTLPLAASLKKQLGKEKVSITYLVNRQLQEFCSQVNEIDAVIADKGIFLKRHRKLFNKQERKAERKKLKKTIQEKNFDIVLCVYAEKASAAFLRQCKIPWRAGPLRRPFFYRFNIFFEHSRKKNNRSEWQANLLYLKAIGLQDEYVRPTFTLPQEPPSLTQLNPILTDKKIILLHPYKRAQTALVWPMDYYYYLAKQLSQDYTLLIIGDKQDKSVLENTFSSLPVSIVCDLSLPQLFVLMQQVYFFIGNASGPLHLAALAELNHMGIFPPDKSTGFQRWQTLPSDKKNYKQILLAPQVDRKCQTCLKEHCSLYSCMQRLLPQETLDILLKNSVIT